MRLTSLDALRGIAALAVVLWHWQHFFFAGPRPPRFGHDDQPWYGLFRLCYEHGRLAVDLFFSLSGFIFFRLYAAPLSEHRLSKRAFFVLRFSRLYPLHLVTLVTVAALQRIHSAANGRSFVYLYNDFWHFVLNLALIPSIGLEKGFSFNGPVWSVSVEAVLYALFFATCWFRLNATILVLGTSLLGFVAITSINEPIGQGIGSFFLGGAACQLLDRITGSPRWSALRAAVPVLAAALWTLTLLSVYTEVDLPVVLLGFVWNALPLGPLLPFPQVVLFPITILALALTEDHRPGFARRLAFLGDISYSAYLWHFPLQLAFVLITQAFGATTDIFRSSGTLLGFLAVLVSVSLLSFHHLEMPAQSALRERWL